MIRFFRSLLVRGIITLVPLVVVGAVLSFVYSLLVSLPVLSNVENDLVRVAIIVVVSTEVTLAVGYLMRTALGTLLEAGLTALMNLFPGVRAIYNAARAVTHSLLLGPDRGPRVVKVEYQPGMRMNAIRTGNRGPKGGEVVFIPGSPDITSGLLAEVDRDRLATANESLVSILIRLLSFGLSDGETTFAVTHPDLEDLGAGPKRGFDD